MRNTTRSQEICRSKARSILDSPSACSNRWRAVTRISIAIRLAAVGDIRGIIIEGDISPNDSSCVGVLHPGFNRIAQFTQASFKKMIGTLDDHQLLRFGKRLHNSLELRPRS